MIALSQPNPDVPTSSLAANTVLQDRYRIVRQLGRGGMGAVYEALDQRLGITVALKETLSTEVSLRKQFECEARLLARMQHPALPRVSDHFVEGNRAFLVMQFIGGVDLARIIAQQPGPFPRDQVIAWADQLLDALIYLHSRDRQVIHRDIKPHNLKLTANGQIALLDFGLAKAQPVDSSLTASRAFFGYTKHYAPLEQIQDQRTDPRSDIYALGATLYHLLTGTKPPDALVRATALINSEPDPLKPANEVHRAVGPQVAVILSKAMAQKSEDRYASAQEFREALRRLGRSNQVEAQRPRPVVGDTDMTRLAAQEQTAVKMVMVASARRFGPGAATTVLVVTLTLAAGIFYASPNWLQAADPAKAASAETNASEQRQPSSVRKAERERRADNVNVAAKTRNQSTANAPARLVEKSFVVSNSSSSGERKEIGSAARKSPLRINAPSIRLPEPDVSNNVPPSLPESGLHGYRLSSEAPQFFRAADGTHIVKFSDGSTRVVRPGERSSQ